MFLWQRQPTQRDSIDDLAGMLKEIGDFGNRP
jgi:hypothetical protein